MYRCFFAFLIELEGSAKLKIKNPQSITV